MTFREFENKSDEEVTKLVLGDQKYFTILVERYQENV
jgi:hypothetical protein